MAQLLPHTVREAKGLMEVLFLALNDAVLECNTSASRERAVMTIGQYHHAAGQLAQHITDLIAKAAEAAEAAKVAKAAAAAKAAKEAAAAAASAAAERRAAVRMERDAQRASDLAAAQARAAADAEECAAKDKAEDAAAAAELAADMAAAELLELAQ